jgi:putative nucleotidyltransferase with HDIG domain
VALYAAALLHHDSRGTAEFPTQQECELDQRRLASRVNRGGQLEVSSVAEAARDAHAILRAFSDEATRDSRGHVGTLAQVLGAAHALEERLEQLLESGDAGDSHPALAFTLGRLRAWSAVDVQNAALPTLPSAMKLMRILADRYLSFQTLESFAKSEAGLAARLLKAANSALYSPRTPIQSLPQAIGYMGIEDSKRILLAAAMEPVLNSLRTSGMFAHAVEAANTAESLAQMTTGVDPSEAYLAGLLHDVGKLAAQSAPPHVLERIDRLVSAGCPAVAVEFVVTGMDHAEAGAGIIRRWKLPEHFAEAVRSHHDPCAGASKLGSILWLTEHLLEPREELPSPRKLEWALKVTGLRAADLKDVRKDRNTILAAL